MKMNPNPNAPISECARCGICCRKGVPALHLDDLELVENGKILLKDLFTIRRGETARDNVRDALYSVESDIVKIKSRKNGACVFLDKNRDEFACSNYENRPLECRILKCWDTREIENIYHRDRLTRKDIVSGVKGLWELVEDHQRQCSPKKIEYLARNLNQCVEEAALKELRELVSLDAHLRSMTVEKGGLDPGMADFLFGRPVSVTIRAFGISIGKNELIIKK